MAARSHSNLSIIEAVETLSSIADLDFDREVGIAQRHETVLHNEKVAYKTVHWLHEQDAISTVHLVRDTFRVILHYLRQFYKKEYGYVTDPKTIEGIKTIMVLVGEAAKKLDKYTRLFHLKQKSVTECKEYKLLQDFYLSKIARKIDEGTLGKWILGLSLGQWKKHTVKLKGKVKLQEAADLESKHVFVDLETVKKDTEYELFFIRKEDGSRFFNPRLLRNIKLVCDFGSYFGEHKGTDPLESVQEWEDRVMHINARNIIKAIGTNKLEHFYHDISRVKNNEVVEGIGKALLALMLSSHSNNLLRHQPAKSCSEYFQDFQDFLHEVLQTRTYQKWLAYPPKSSNTVAVDVMDLIHAICSAIYNNLLGMEEMVTVIKGLMQEAWQGVPAENREVNQTMVSKKIADDHAVMQKIIKRHPNGPLLKVLNILDTDSFHHFNPLLQYNIPNQLFDLYVQNQRISNLRLGAPIYQDFIHKAVVTEEFKGFLRHYNQEGIQKKHLLFNLDDRTSWRGHARSQALEDLQKQQEFSKTLTVVTLATDTDFYHQLAPYHQVNHADTFIEQFKQHLKSDSAGFYFPSSIDKTQLLQYAGQSMHAIHRIFFSNKNVLTKEQRLDFIEIFYLFLQLKIIDWIRPDSFSMTCKDGIDTGAAYSAELFVLIKLLNGSKWQESDYDFLNFILYSPSLLIRERIMLADRFNRMLSALKTIENTYQELGSDQFSMLVQTKLFKHFDLPVSQSVLLLPG